MTLPAQKWTGYSTYLVSERAYLLYEEGRFYEALILFEGLLELDPENAYCRDAISAIYLALRQPEQAIRHATMLFEANPAHVSALVRRCEAYLMLGMTQEAERDLQTLKMLRANAMTLRMEMRLNAIAEPAIDATSTGRNLSRNSAQLQQTDVDN